MKQDVSVAVEVMPSNPDASFQQGSNGGSQPSTSQGALGLTLAPLTPDLRSQLNLPDDASGAVIANVTPNSLADQAGLQQGDLLVGVGPTDVTTPDGAVTAINAARKSGAGAVALRIVRQGQALFVGITLGSGNDSEQQQQQQQRQLTAELAGKVRVRSFWLRASCAELKRESPSVKKGKHDRTESDHAFGRPSQGGRPFLS